MEFRFGKRSLRLTRHHAQGMVAGGLFVGAVVGGLAASHLELTGQDVRWLGRRLVEKRQLIEHQRGEIAALVAAVENVSAELEHVVGKLDTPPSDMRLAAFDIDEAPNPVADNFLTNRSGVATVVTRLEDVGDRLASLGDEAAFAAATAPPPNSVGGDVPSTWPLGGRVTSGFGMRVAPIRGGWRLHPGLDISAPAGSPVSASGGGLVSFAGYRRGYGRTVVLDHGDGLKTLYAHMSRLATREGRHLREGDVIGFVGSSGRSTGPHLHYEVRFRGEPVDPMCYLGQQPVHPAPNVLTTPG